jgi:hypothetical protein
MCATLVSATVVTPEFKVEVRVVETARFVGESAPAVNTEAQGNAVTEDATSNNGPTHARHWTNVVI